MSDKIAKIKSEKRHLSVHFTREAVNEEKRTVELSFSSESPVPRWFGEEILDHAKDSVDLSRLRNGGALLVDHNPRDHVGVVESCEIAGDKKGRATVRFGKSPRAQEIFQDVLDGIRTLVSVGYEIEKVIREKEENGLETYRVTRWTPYEISIVSIPADPSVGVGRNNNNEDSNMKRILLDPAPAPGGGGAPAPAPAPTVNVEEITRNARTAEEKRVRELVAIGERFEVRELAMKAISEGKTVEQFKCDVLEVRHNAKPLTPAETKSEVGMSEKEKRNYSLVRAIRMLSEGKPLDGLEKEASEAVAKQTRNSPKGFFVPVDVTGAMFRRAPEELRQMQRALNVNSQSAGGYLVGTDVQWGSMIELLRNNMVVNSLGARMLSGLVGNIAVPKHTGGATAYWLSETEEVSATQQTFGQLYLVPHRLGARTAFSKQLLSQASIDVEALVREDLMTVLAIEKDRAALNGSGVDGEPLGILNTTGINSLTFGGAPIWADAVEFEKLVEDDNVPFNGSEAYLTTPAAKAKWKTTVKESGQAIYLWDNNTVNGYPAKSTKQVPSDKMIFGKWSDLIIADWDGIDVVVDNLTLAPTAQIQIIINMLTDNGVRNAVSFVASSDSAAQ